MSDPTMTEIQKFKDACPEYGTEFLDNDFNAGILQQYLQTNNLPFIADTLAAGFLLNRSKMQKGLIPAPKKDPPNLGNRPWSIHTDGQRELVEARQKAETEIEQVKTEMRATIERSKKIARGELVETPRMVPLPDDATEAQMRAASVEQLKEYSRRQAGKISLEERLRWQRGAR